MATIAGSPPGPIPYDFAVGQSTNTLIRVRTLPMNLLEVVRATPGAAITWSANLITANAGAGQGVACYVTGIAADVFAFLNDDRTLKHYRTADIEATPVVWDTYTVYALSAQPETSFNRITAPGASVCFFTDSSGVTGTQVYLSHFNGAIWDVTPTAWGLGNQKLLIERAYYFSATQNQSYHSTLTSIAIGTDDYLLAFYAERPCDLFDEGIWTMRVSNAGTSSALWQQPERLFATTVPTNLKQSASNLTGAFLFGALPKFCKIGNEYWLLGSEYSQFAGQTVQHLAYWRSADGVNFSDRQYLAGTDFIHTNGLAYFTGVDLVFGQMLVVGTTAYLFGYDRTWTAQASFLTGADNGTLKHDASAHVMAWTLSQPGAGQAATANTTLTNGDHTYNTAATRTLVRRGARLTRKTGYVTPSGDELVTVSTELVDEVRQGVQVQGDTLTNTLEVTSRDYLKHLLDWSPDLYYEFNSGIQLSIGSAAVAGFNDLTGVVALNGTFTTANGILYPGLLDTSSSFPDNFCIVNTGQLTHDGILEVRFSHNGAWKTDGTDYFGVAFGVQDNQHYYAYLYNKEKSPNENKWYLYQASTPTSGTNVVTYTAIGTGYSAYYSPAPINYWLRLQVYHNRVAIYSSPLERAGWSPLLSTTTAITPRAGYMGIIGRGHLTAPQKQGPTTFTGEFDQGVWLNDVNPIRLGKRMDYAVRIQAQMTGFLRGVSMLMDRSAVGSEYVPDMTVAVVADNGTDHTGPADLADPGNWLASTSVSVNELPILGPTAQWTNVLFTTSAEVTAGTYYWVWVHANGHMPLCYDNQAMCGDPMMLHYNTVGASIWPALYSYNTEGGANPNWYDFDDFDVDGVPNLCMFESLNDAGTSFSAMFFASSEPPKTLESIATAIAAKSGVLTMATDAQITDVFASDSLGADGGDYNWNNIQVGTWSVGSGVLTGTGPSASTYGYRRSNSTRGTLNDGVVECKIKLLSTTARAGILVRAANLPGLGLKAYALVINYELQAVDFIKITNTSPTLLYRSYALTPFPTNEWMDVTVACQAGYYTLYIDRVLMGAFFDNAYTVAGYVGLCINGGDTAGTVAQFDNFRVPDLGNIKPYFAVEARTSGKAALDRLIQKDRARYFARYDGALRLSRFRTRAVQDSYAHEILGSTRTDSDRYWFSHLQPEGNYFADRFSASLLDSDGRRFKHEDYTDAQTDSQAWADAELPLRLAEEMSVQYQIQVPANPCLEREDRVQVTNQEDGELNGDWIVNDIELEFRRDEGNVVFDESVALRRYVS